MDVSTPLFKELPSLFVRIEGARPVLALRDQPWRLAPLVPHVHVRAVVHEVLGQHGSTEIDGADQCGLSLVVAALMLLPSSKQYLIASKARSWRETESGWNQRSPY